MSIRVLIYVTAHTDSVDIHHELTTRLAQSLSGKIDVMLATSADKDLMQHVGDCDILHVFGCWSNSACTLCRKAYSRKVPYIITPLGGLQPWEMVHHNNTLLQNNQKKATQRATAIHVCGKLEQQTFDRLGWNKNVCQIKNPVLTSLATFEDLTSGMLALYRKALDSNARLRIGDREAEAIGRLVQIGIDAQAVSDKTVVAALKETLASLSDEAWRRILIYIADENIEEIVKEALAIIEVAYPHLDIQTIDRFDTDTPYAKEPLKDDALLSRNILLRNKVKEAFANNDINNGTSSDITEQRVCTALLNLQYEINHDAVPLRHLADLYSLMRYANFDEDIFKIMAREMGIAEFAGRVMSVMANVLRLTEGFMPVVPKNDSKTLEMQKQITKFGIYKHSP